ncbi:MULTISPECIES: urease accessory protein UreD [unclassified Devosia]|uniref:urease accessory protein UreD n=1 Tax=unclassified Devosia TaxID=196773 RepID=UPI00155724B9|nr:MULTISPECIES: urease accessory protein UreD [unclassified Devosia]
MKHSPIIDLAHTPLQRARGAGRLGTKERAGATRIDTLCQEGCAKIRLPNTHGPHLEAVLINTAGGLTGGDQMAWSAQVAPDGKLLVTTQACERIYRSLGGPAQVQARLEVRAGAHLDWMPQETILFEHSALNRRIDIELEAGATLTAVEAVLLGRDAMGETASHAALTDQWRVRREGRLIHAEANRLTPESLPREGLSLLAGHRAFATILHIAASADAAEAQLARVRQTIADLDGPVAASVVGERLVIRALAPGGLALRRQIVPLLAQLSGTGSVPRLWHL